jgi:uncharacterized protein HemY
MQLTITHLMEKALPAFAGRLPLDPVKFSPSDIRHGIQQLVNNNEMPLAQALVDAGLTLYPESEDLLAMGGLMALTQQNWTEAVELLEQLLKVQGPHAPVMTYKMLVRAQRCNLDLARAQRILAQGLAQWPQDPTLLEEQDDFLDGPAVMPSPELTN